MDNTDRASRHVDAHMDAYLKAGAALREFAPEMGPIQRTAIVQVVLDAALEVIALSRPTPEHKEE